MIRGLGVTRRMVGTVGLVMTLAATGVLACGSDAGAAPEQTPTAEAGVAGRALTIGDISDEPVKKIERFTPLAEYLASNLEGSGFSGGDVKIAPSIDEMIQFMSDGQVDVYMDSFYPALVVSEDGGATVSLVRGKGDSITYAGMIVARRDADITSISDLAGHVVAAEEQYSTSGFALQTNELLHSGMKVRVVDTPESVVGSDEVGLWFSRDEENSVFALESGRVDVAFMSDQDFADLPRELYSLLSPVLTTPQYPRQIVVIRSALTESTRDRIESLLVGLLDTEEGLELLDHTKSDVFVELTSKQSEELATIQRYLPDIRSVVAD